MHNAYRDIIDGFPGAPQWWDEQAVPRYCEFHPDQCADIYANEACLLHIECQACGAAFKVAMTWSIYEAIRRGRLIGQEITSVQDAPTLADFIVDQTIHFGDPPNYGCCPAGPTMNSIPRRVLEYWKRDNMEWARDPEHEITLEPDWATPTKES